MVDLHFGCELKRGAPKDGDIGEGHVLGARSVQANGISIAYALEGPAEAPVVAFCNSLTSNFLIWDRVLAVLGGAYRVLRYDLRGHGGSTATTGEYSMRLLGQDFLALLDALGLRRVHVVGLSIGGMIAQQVAATARDQIASLTICASFAESAKGVWEPRIATARRDGLAPLLASTLSRWFAAETRERDPDLVEATGRMILGTSVDGYVGCAAALRDLHLTPMLRDIRAPALLIAGAEDVSAPPATMESMSNAISGSSLIVLPRAAHMLALERPLELAGLIGGFLERAR